MRRRSGIVVQIAFLLLVFVFIYPNTVLATNQPWKNPPIPTGWTYVTGSWDTGFVIKDAHGNEFVWVPVGDIYEFRGKAALKTYDWNKGLVAPEKVRYVDDDNVIIVNNAIAATGGFYVARYEASSNYQNGICITQSKKNVTPWNIDWHESKISSESMATDYGWIGLYSHLLYDKEWDIIVKWLEKSGVNVTDSSSYGNYTDYSGSFCNTGSIETYKKNNIYDLAGNMQEWTMEEWMGYDNQKLLRGGSYKSAGYNAPVANRNWGLENTSNSSIGFRPAFVVLNSAPSVVINSPEINKAFSDIDGYNQITITGTVTDADNDDMTVYLRVKKGSEIIISQEQTISQCGGSGKPFSFQYTINNLMPEGTYTVDVWANDSAVESNHINRNMLIDKTAPLSPVLTGVPADWVNTDTQITVSNLVDPVSNGVSSGVKQVDYEVNENLRSNPGAGNFQISITDEGTHNLSVRVIDNVGHTGPDATAVIRIDKTAPVITVTVEDNGVYHNSVSPVFSATDSGGSGLASCSATLAKDGETPTPFVSGTVVNTPGIYTLVINASDTATNTVSQTVTFTLSAPVAPAEPTVTALGPQAIKIDWTAVEGATGYLVNNGAVQIADTESLSYTQEGLTPNSIHSYTIVAYSSMGNSPASPETVVYTLANEVTNLQVTSKTSTSLTVSWEANENPSGTEYIVSISDGDGYINDIPYTADKLNHEFTGLNLGKDYIITVKARNGDLKETTGVSITAATNKAPVIEIAAPLPDAAFSNVEGHNVITVSGTVTDDDNDNVTVTAAINGVKKSTVVNNCAGGKPFALDFDVVTDDIPEGPHTVTVIADDEK